MAPPDDPTTPKTDPPVDPDHAFPSLYRAPTYPGARRPYAQGSVNPAVMQRIVPPEGGESSGDETSAIIQRERGGHKSYQTATAKQSQPPNSGTSVGLDGTDDARQRPPAERKRWWKEMLNKYGAVELENKGSVARDHLANERTFLAWLRTSLSFASIGIAVTQLFRLDQTLQSNPSREDNSQLVKLRHIGRPLGATFIAVGAVTLIIGFQRYFENQHYVMLGKFPASRGSVALVTLIAGSLIVASLAIIIGVAPAVLA